MHYFMFLRWKLVQTLFVCIIISTMKTVSRHEIKILDRDGSYHLRWTLVRDSVRLVTWRSIQAMMSGIIFCCLIQKTIIHVHEFAYNHYRLSLIILYVKYLAIRSNCHRISKFQVVMTMGDVVGFMLSPTVGRYDSDKRRRKITTSLCVWLK